MEELFNTSMSIYMLEAEALGDMDWFILLNEERLFDPHEALGTPNSAEHNWSTRDIVFPSISPVQSFDGTHAARLVNKACLLIGKGETTKKKNNFKPSH